MDAGKLFLKTHGLLPPRTACPNAGRHPSAIFLRGMREASCGRSSCRRWERGNRGHGDAGVGIRSWGAGLELELRQSRSCNRQARYLT